MNKAGNFPSVFISKHSLDFYKLFTPYEKANFVAIRDCIVRCKGNTIILLLPQKVGHIISDCTIAIVFPQNILWQGSFDLVLVPTQEN